MEQSIESIFQRTIDDGKINGVIICATDAQGHFVYNIALGQRIPLGGEKQPQRLDDVLSLHSATKLITTIAALQCVDNGILSLDGDISSIIPELTAQKVIIGFSEDSETPILEEVNSPVTLRMLLTHSAGTQYYFTDPLLARWADKFNPLKPEDKKPVETAWAHPLRFQPGSSWMYGSGLDWVGRVVERITGKTLGHYMQQNIFDPLEIHDAEFYPVTRQDLRARLVDLTAEDPQGTGIAVSGQAARANELLSGHFGGHGLYMTAQDYIKVLKSLLANDGKLLKPSSADSMFQHHLSPEATLAHQTITDGPMGALLRVGIDSPTKVGFGFGGLVTLEDIEGLYGSKTLTWGGGLTLVWFIDRKTDLCGICAIAAIQGKPLPDFNICNGLKQVFRHGIYTKLEEHREALAGEE